MDFRAWLSMPKPRPPKLSFHTTGHTSNRLNPQVSQAADLPKGDETAERTV